MTASPPDVFVSYNKNDLAWAEWIAWVLEEGGHTVRIQAWDFRPGNNFVLEMQEAAKARRTIAVLSESYLQAAFTQPEWAAAFAADPQGKERKLLPFRVASCQPTGLLKALIYQDLVGLDEAAARAKVLGVFEVRAKPKVAPVFPGRPKVAFPGADGEGTALAEIAPEPSDPTRTARRETLLRRIDGILRKDGGAVAAAIAELAPPVGKVEWRAAYAEAGALGLFEALERSKLLDVLLALDQAHEERLPVPEAGEELPPPSAEARQTAKGIEDLVNLLVPYLYQSGTAQRFDLNGSTVISLPVASPTLAEIVLAEAEQRPLSLCPPERPDDDPRSRYALPEPTSREPLLGNGAFGLLVQELCSLLPSEKQRQCRDASIAPERRLEQMIGHLNRFFDGEVKGRQPRRYYLLPVERAKQVEAELADKVRARLPQLKIVHRTGDDLLAESELYAPVVRILFRARQHP
jgi:hypothetical protein